MFFVLKLKFEDVNVQYLSIKVINLVH